jgi:hypothetical protein
VLTRAGVIDAGGKGLCVIYDGMEAALLGRDVVEILHFIAYFLAPGDFPLQFALAAAGAAALAVFAAFLAASGLVLKALFGVEFLFTGGEDEFVAAFLADEGSVFVHVLIYLA